jgi:hypothetical protein
VDVGEHLEFRRAADVVAVAAGAVADDFLPPLFWRIWPGSNGSIMPVVSAMRRIHLSLLMLI